MWAIPSLERDKAARERSESLTKFRKNQLRARKRYWARLNCCVRSARLTLARQNSAWLGLVQRGATRRSLARQVKTARSFTREGALVFALARTAHDRAAAGRSEPNSIKFCPGLRNRRNHFHHEKL
jgi:hypothetical protein